MKLKWLDKIAVELPIIMPHVRAYCMYANRWLSGASSTGTPQGCGHDRSISLHGIVDDFTVKLSLNFYFLSLNQQMHATYNFIVFL
jgi:hypothetical protein